jgi:hypothetical protein
MSCLQEARCGQSAGGLIQLSGRTGRSRIEADNQGRLHVRGLKLVERVFQCQIGAFSRAREWINPAINNPGPWLQTALWWGIISLFGENAKSARLNQ